MQRDIIYPDVKIQDVIKTFWRGIKPQAMWMYFLIFCVIAGNIISIITPIFYKKFFDIIIISEDKNLIAQKLLVIIIYVASLNLLFWFFYRFATYANINYQISTTARLKQQSYDHLMQHSYSFFTNNFVGSLVQRINRFTRAYERLSDHFIWDLLPLCVRTIAIFIVVLFINRFIAFIILIWTIIFLSFNLIFSRWKLKYDLEVAQIDSETTGYLADTITNHNITRLFGAFKYESEGYKKITNEQAKITKFVWRLDSVIVGSQSFLSFSIEFILLFFAIKYWQQGLITIGVFVLLQAYLINLINQLWGVTRIVKDIYQSYADAKEMVEILLLPHEIKDLPKAQELFVGKGEIKFKDLSFSFNGKRKVLENINLIINTGEKVGLVGPSGAGKTTFVRLLLRLHSPTSGKISIDNQDISMVTQESLRKNISMVPQDPVLFHRTLAENIGYGKIGASKDEIERVAKLSHCDEFIYDLPFKFQTLVGERGVKLSGGERQRVAIARAILKATPILILDEATSNLDSHSEMLIQDALNTLMKDRTTIVIAHRLSTIQKMDRIIVINNGKIIEEGSHNNLLAKSDSLYHRLWTLQVGGFLLSDNAKEEVEEEKGVIVQEGDDDYEKEKIEIGKF